MQINFLLKLCTHATKGSTSSLKRFLKDPLVPRNTKESKWQLRRKKKKQQKKRVITNYHLYIVQLW